jgi:hypothetical protein
MPKRWCTCTGCPNCKPDGCTQLFDLDTTQTRRCPPCQQTADQRATQRRARATQGRPSATRRGYGPVYQRRAAAITTQAKRNAEPCTICDQPCLPHQDIVAHHLDGRPAQADPATCRLGPAHKWCNDGYRKPR